MAELDQSCLDHLLGYQLTRANIPSRQVFLRGLGIPLELSPVEFTILVLLDHNAEVSPKQLARALEVAAPAVTLLLDRLMHRGLLTRLRSETDGRAQRIRLTPEGQVLARRAHRRSLNLEADLVAVLSESERVILKRLLRKVAGYRPKEADRSRPDSQTGRGNSR